MRGTYKCEKQEDRRSGFKHAWCTEFARFVAVDAQITTTGTVDQYDKDSEARDARSCAVKQNVEDDFPGENTLGQVMRRTQHDVRRSGLVC